MSGQNFANYCDQLFAALSNAQSAFRYGRETKGDLLVHQFTSMTLDVIDNVFSELREYGIHIPSYGASNDVVSYQVDRDYAQAGLNVLDARTAFQADDFQVAASHLNSARCLLLGVMNVVGRAAAQTSNDLVTP